MARTRRIRRRSNPRGLTGQLLREVSLLRTEIGRVADELHSANLIQHHRIIAQQQDRSIDDPVLADAMSTLKGLPVQKRRQLMFANRTYAAILLAHRTGSLSREELLGHLRVLCRNRLFVEYWENTTEQRRSLPEECLEAEVGRAVDAIIEEIPDDLEEWWIVGPPVL
ncbi:DUF6082 family protein [Streptomyces sp. NPDC048504]|uniref:DUF6082 family protein n=1 Tax=Streptomyces sp. NPDC048504 TaxID=3365559 RepID=UPI00370FB716